MSAAAPAIASAHPNTTRHASYTQGALFQFAVFALGFLILCSRRPDAVLNPQFYAEDGAIFYRDAYSLGFHSLLLTHGGYFHAVPRLAALLAQLFPLLWAPLVLNLIAIAIQILPVNVFLSSRFSNINFLARLLASFVYLALPNSFEIHATITNAQSHLVLLACLILLAAPGKTRAWKIFDGMVLVLTSLSSPMGALLAPLAALIWWKRASSAWQFATLLPGSVIQAICVLTHWHTREAPHFILSGQPIFNGGPLGANFHNLNAILGRQVFYSSLLGLNAQNWVVHLHRVSVVETALTTLGLAVVVYAFRHAPFELKLFILFAAAVLACALVNPLAGPPDRPQWDWLSVPGIGNRYYFLPMLAFLASLFWVAMNQLPAVARYSAVALLLLLPIGICQDWRYPAFEDFRFKEFVRVFDNQPPGTRFAIPINPGWFMLLIKH
jgi:hypothetical protein